MIKRSNLENWYDSNYKKVLILPAVLLLLGILYLGFFYAQHGDVLRKDVSLSGGTTITISSQMSASELEAQLKEVFQDVQVTSLLDNNGKQTQLVITTLETPEKIIPSIEKIIGEKITDKNASTEYTGSALGKNFYQQLIIAILIAFFWMAAVVFVIFATSFKEKMWAILLNLLLGFFLGKLFLVLPLILSIIILLAFIISISYIYIKYSMPSFAVMSCAFADILLTLVIVDMMGMRISGAGIVAFLMLIGYSVDTDILLTTRVLKRKGTSINHEIFSSFKTGMTMTLTAIASVAVALFFVYSFKTALNQIFTILLVGLFFDMFNTWITNTSLIKWFGEKNLHNINQ